MVLGGAEGDAMLRPLHMAFTLVLGVVIDAVRLLGMDQGNLPRRGGALLQSAGLFRIEENSIDIGLQEPAVSRLGEENDAVFGIEPAVPAVQHQDRHGRFLQEKGDPFRGKRGRADRLLQLLSLDSSEAVSIDLDQDLLPRRGRVGLRLGKEKE
jgi:hypothetical protein